MDPERELWCAVLHQAISDLVGNTPKEKNREILRRQTLGWFMSPRVLAGSFVWICEMLGLDESAVRREVFEQPARRYRLERF